MKYIRTNEGIFEVLDRETDICVLTNRAWKYKKDIIAEADTLEKLCDEFVYCYRDDMPILVNEEQIKQLILLDRIQDVRGAIWTPKGLIYVAKMNKEGALELI